MPDNNNTPNGSILLTFDIEDWFQVENFKKYIPFSSWDSCELRVEKNTHCILDLLDSIKGSRLKAQGSGEKPPGGSPTPCALRPAPEMLSSSVDVSSASLLPAPCPMHVGSSPTPYPLRLRLPVQATFFVLGWIAKRLPDLVREIYSRGHEVASHGYDHYLCGNQEKNHFRKDLIDSRRLLEDIIGKRVYGYRAPSFSVTNDILGIIEECGYLYDSSYNSFSINKRYGKLHLNGKVKDGILYKMSDKFYELPISNLGIGRRILPWGGGGYFRIIPSRVFYKGARSILKYQTGYLFYLHPWEMDPIQPTVNFAKLFYRIRHYTNLKKTSTKLSNFINHFQDCDFLTCYQYLAKKDKGGEYAQYSPEPLQKRGGL
jgi:peptidoglycan-N-acetylglucosamine deacetylase